MGDPQPRMMLPQLGDQVVGYKAHCPSQSVQHNSHKGLETSECTMKETPELVFLSDQK